jgi:hypothetical protein
LRPRHPAVVGAQAIVRAKTAQIVVSARWKALPTLHARNASALRKSSPFYPPSACPRSGLLPRTCEGIGKYTASTCSVREALLARRLRMMPASGFPLDAICQCRLYTSLTSVRAACACKLVVRWRDFQFGKIFTWVQGSLGVQNRRSPEKRYFELARTKCSSKLPECNNFCPSITVPLYSRSSRAAEVKICCGLFG